MTRIFSLLAVLAVLSTPSLAADKIAYFAGGCFWCTEADFEKIDGVGDVISGFMGGDEANPSYEDVAYGRTLHREVVKVPYDDSKVSYQALLSAFWRMHDPTDATGSFVDRGRHYSTAIYFANDAQKVLAAGAIEALEQSGKFDRPVATALEPAGAFYRAEEYHQDYYKKAGYKYTYYRFRSGRDNFIARYWDGDDTLYQLAAR
jgi:peptide methionine sulfoxide reductase msrA/msrB